MGDDFPEDLFDDLPERVEEVEEDEVTIDYQLPSGHIIVCMTDEEVHIAKETAGPYVLNAPEIASEDWLHIKNFVEMVLLRERTLAQTRGSKFAKLDHKSQKEIRASVVSLSGEISDFAKRLDPLKAKRNDQGESPVEWRLDVERKAKQYAQDHIGEFTWMAQCPNVECRHNNEPFYMILETPHFAMDPSVGPGVIWNEQVMELVHKHYCQDPECKHIAHRSRYSGSLSLRDAAAILRVSAIGLIGIATLDREYDLGFKCDLDDPDSLKPYIR